MQGKKYTARGYPVMKKWMIPLFITFDRVEALREDYYDPGINRDMPEDTIDLIIYANNQIKRENSPIKSIVLDLSNNGGGQYRRSHICDRVVSGGSGYRSQGHLYRS